MSETEGTEGQPSEGTQATETTGAGTEGEAGQSVDEGQTTQAGTEPSHESFFDPQNVHPDLQAPYKDMQSAFSKKMAGFKDQQSKIDAYDQFQANPQAYIQQLAQQYGLSTVTGDKPNAEGFNPETWEDVMSQAKKEVMADIAPQMKKLQQNQLEKTLDDISPDWRLYEDKMMVTLRSHPTLVGDPETLYRMSVPSEVMESRATQAALKKLQNKGEHAQVSGGSQTSKSENNQPRANNFNEAVKIAQANLAAQGIRP
jgi:hypothetical protein